VLQNRLHSPNTDEDTFYALLAALDAGWRVEPLILRRETGTTMVSVADSSRIRAFVQEHGLPINAPKR
jgi:hypothetical protein